VNKALGRRGQVVRERYHFRVLATPTEVRNALRYVLLDGTKHAAQRLRREGKKLAARAKAWLLAKGWQRAGGLLDLRDIPGPA
jgi:hypothetical protein